MTISSTNRKAGPFIGNGSASVFAFSFRVFAASDLEVVRITVATGVEATLTINSAYTVSLNADQNSNPGGSITLTGGALASGYNLIITSDIANLQPTDLTNQGGFYPEVITGALDRATIQIQQLDEHVARTLSYPITDPTVGTELPPLEQRKGTVLAFDETTGAPEAGPSVGAILTVSGNIAGINTVATNIASVNTAAGSISSVNTVAGSIGSVNTVSGINASVTAVAAIDDKVVIAADNVADINNFADVYQGGKAANPTLRNDGTALQTGDLYFNSVNDRMRVYEVGTGWIDYEATAQTAATTATTQAGIATTQAGIATTQASTATAQATAASTARAAAETARDAAFSNATVYASVAAGLAAVAVGQQFQVVTADEIIRYRVDAGPVATVVARIRPSSFTRQVLGAVSTPVVGTATTARSLYAFQSPTLGDGYLDKLDAYALIAGTIIVKRFTRVSLVLTQVGPDYPVTLSAGLNALTRADFGKIPVNTGETLGFFQYAAIISTQTALTSGNTYKSNDAMSTSRYTIGSSTNNDALQINFNCVYGPVESAAGRLDAIDRASQLVSSGIQNVGLDSSVTPSDLGTSVLAYTFAFEAPLLAPGVITKLRCYARTGGVLAVKRFSRIGNDFTQVGNDYLVTVLAGVNNLSGTSLGYIPVEAGEYLAFFQVSAVLSYGSSSIAINNLATLVYNAPSPGDFTSFTSASANGSNTIQLGFEVSLGRENRYEYLANLQEAGSEDQFIGDTIADAQVALSGLTWTASVVLDRGGTKLGISGTGTLSATTGSNIRYDHLYLDTSTLTLAISQGTERANDPTAFVPSLTDSKRSSVGLLRAVSGAMTFVPTWTVYDGRVRTISSLVEREFERSRRLLPRTLSRIRKGAALSILGLGDSITALQSAVPSPSTPNGLLRDAAAASGTLYTYLRELYGSDVVNALPLYTSVQLGRSDDGGGAIHTRIGWNWELVSSLEAMGYVLGSTLTYNNFALGSTNTGNLWAAGAPTGWLTSALALSPNLTVLSMGMNERGSTSTEANLINIIQTIKAAGSDVIVVDCPRNRASPNDDYYFTNRAIRRAAEFAGAAHLSLVPLYDDRFIQAIGISTLDVCAANGNNHPGLEELKAIGRELSRLVLG